MEGAYAEINTWIVMGITVMKAEYPAWEILQAFTPFDILTVDRFAGALQDHLRRLSLAFKLPLDELRRQYGIALPAAQALAAAHPEMSNQDLWVAVWEQIGGSMRGGALEKALARKCAFSGCTTSGVEHNHSRQDWLFTKRRPTSLQTELDEIAIVVDLDQDSSELPAILELAQAIWRKLYTGVRARPHGRPRADKGGTRTLKDNTFAAMMRTHADTVAAASCSSVGLSALQDAAVPQVLDSWKDTYNAEVDFNANKRRIHKLETMASGHCLPHELHGTAAQDLESLRKRQRVNKRDRLLRAINRIKTLGGKPIIGERSSVYVDPSANDLSVVQFCDTNFLPLVADPVAASAVVVEIPANMPFAVTWALTLSGGVACTPALLMGKPGGSGITFKAIVGTGQRMLWVSKPFKFEHAELYNVFQRTINMPGSTWHEVDRDRWAEMVSQNQRRPNNQQRNMQYLGLVADSQAAQADNALFFTAVLLQRKLCKFTACALGACGT